MRIVGSTTQAIRVTIPELDVDELILRGSFLEVFSSTSADIMMVSNDNA